MRSDATTVTDYVSGVPEEWRVVAERLARTCRDGLPEFDASIRYGMPTYSRDGVAELAWAVQRRYLSVYVMRSDVLGGHSAELTGLDVGKGCVRFARPAQVDLRLVQAFVVETAASRGPVC